VRACVGLRLAIVVAAVPCALGATGALAAWTSPGSGSAAGRAYDMPAAGTPVAGASGANVAVRWPAATFPNGTAVHGYVIHRYDATTGAPQTVGSGCAGTVTTTTCTEQNVPAGHWTYTDTPTQDLWTGGESAHSNAVTISGAAPSPPAAPQPSKPSSPPSSSSRAEAADLTVQLLSAVTPAPSGDTFTYTFAVRDRGPDAARGVVLATAVPDGTHLASIAASGWTCDAPPAGGTGRIECRRQRLADGEETSVTLTATGAPGSDGAVSAAARVASESTDPVPADNAGTLTAQP
jgi:uncharacterized repeat protein (TIGR01451 family)